MRRAFRFTSQPGLFSSSSSLSQSRAQVAFFQSQERTMASKVMFQHQSKLPKLPVPDLNETCALYLKSVRPFLNEAEFDRTRQAVEEFVKPNGMGQELQRRLKERDAQVNSSWLIDWWNDYAYMAYRDPVVIYVSYFYVFRDDKFRRLPAARAASLLRGAMQFRDVVINEHIEPDMNRTTPLCMLQYKHMFNSTRIPKVPSDVTRGSDPETNNHVVVMRKNKFYSFDLKPRGKHMSTAEIEVQLRKIYAAAGQDKSAPVGLLTTENRDVWTKLREELLAVSETNKKSLDVIERAVLVLCLDDTKPVTREESSRACWHGDGRNRFFDKSLQLIVFDNGKAGFNGEHSMMDATPTSRMCEYIIEGLDKGKIEHGSPVPSAQLADPVALPFDLTPSLEKALDEAGKKFDQLIDKHELRVVVYEGFGKELIKKLRVSPDAFAQMAIQLAYYKMNGYCKPTYESAQTKKFAHGRTETCRSVSLESVEWVKAMEDPYIPVKVKGELGRKAITAQSSYMAKAVEARGCDRHLLGLRLLIKPNETKPSIFTDPAYASTCHWNLSTSQITSEYYDGYGWGEVVPDGWGVAYMVKDNALHFNLTSLKLGAEQFRHYFHEALNEMKVVFEATIPDATVKAKFDEHGDYIASRRTSVASLDISSFSLNPSSRSGSALFSPGQEFTLRHAWDKLESIQSTDNLAPPSVHTQTSDKTELTLQTPIQADLNTPTDTPSTALNPSPLDKLGDLTLHTQSDQVCLLSPRMNKVKPSTLPKLDSDMAPPLKKSQFVAERIRVALNIPMHSTAEYCHRHHTHDCAEDMLKDTQKIIKNLRVDAEKLSALSNEIWEIQKDDPWGYYMTERASRKDKQEQLQKEWQRRKEFFTQIKQLVEESREGKKDQDILPEISPNLVIPKYVTPKKKKEITQVAFGTKYVCAQNTYRHPLLHLPLRKRRPNPRSGNASRGTGTAESRNVQTAATAESSASTEEPWMEKRLTALEIGQLAQLGSVIHYDNNPKSEAARLLSILKKRPHERSEREINVIFKRISHLKAFQKLSKFMLTELCSVMRVVCYPENRVIFKQGDEGTSWYIALTGELNVIKEMGSENIVLVKLRSGDGFGELALVNDAPRAATVLATTPVILLQLEKSEYNRIVKVMHLTELQQKMHFLMKHTAIKDLSSLIRLSICSVMQLQQHGPGAVLIRQGDPLTEFWFVKKGTCSVYKNFPQTDILVKMGHLTLGDHYGEMLVQKNPAETRSETSPVTIIADTEVEIGSLKSHDAWSKMSREVELGPFFKIPVDKIEENHRESLKKKDWNKLKNKVMDSLLKERYRNPLIKFKEFKKAQDVGDVTHIRELL